MRTHRALLSLCLTGLSGAALANCGWGEHGTSHEARVEPTATPAHTNFTGQTWGNPQQRDTVKGYIKKLMDETHQVPDTAAKKGGPRGSPGSSDKLAPGQLEELISTVIFGAEKLMPASLKDEEKWALICVEMSVESAFVPNTSGVNPGDNSKRSVGVLQLTLPGMWDDIWRSHGKVDGLIHYDGSPWSPKDTTNDQLEHSIWDGAIAALWAITEQGRRGAPDNFDGPDGPMPKTWRTSELCWVLGAPAARSGNDLAGQREAYQVDQEAELKFLGFDPSLFDTAY